jgi:hypothetical protein
MNKASNPPRLLIALAVSDNPEGPYRDLHAPWFETRPWKIHAEGPTATRGMKRNNKGEEKERWDWRKKFTAEDIRFTTKGDALYAIALAWPEDGKLMVRSLAKGAGPNVASVRLLGHEGPLTWDQSAHGLEVTLPADQRDLAEDPRYADNSRRWKPCCWRRCAGLMIPIVCGTNRTTDSLLSKRTFARDDREMRLSKLRGLTLTLTIAATAGST